MSKFDDDDFSTLVRRLSQAPALNGGWDKVRNDLSDLEADVKGIRQTVCEQERQLAAIDLKLNIIVKLGWIIIGAVITSFAKELIGLL
jgi:hypothetical protein